MLAVVNYFVGEAPALGRRDFVMSTVLDYLKKGRVVLVCPHVFAIDYYRSMLTAENKKSVRLTPSLKESARVSVLDSFDNYKTSVALTTQSFLDCYGKTWPDVYSLHFVEYPKENVNVSKVANENIDCLRVCFYLDSDELYRPISVS